MGDPAGSRLSPDPLGLHPETLGDHVSCEQPVQDLVLDVGSEDYSATP